MQQGREKAASDAAAVLVGASMDQRAASLQQRLQARRDMFFKTEASPNSTTATQSYSSARIGSSSTSSSTSSTTSSGVSSAAASSSAAAAAATQSNSAPPPGQQSAAAASSTPRNVRDALNILNSNKEAKINGSHHPATSDTDSGRKYSSSSNASSEHNSQQQHQESQQQGDCGRPVVPAKPPVPAARYNSGSVSSAVKPLSTAPSSLVGGGAGSLAPEVAARADKTGAATGAPPQAPPAKKARLLDGYVGFANLPNQVYRKSVKRGFEFTLMVAGESGLGKSTLINSMFLTDVYSPDYPGPSARIKKTVQVETNKVLLNESGVNLMLTIVDTPGFGDAVDNSECWSPLIAYVESQYEAFLDAETRVHRVPLPDTRVHACLYFVSPSGHGLKPLDVEFMKRLHDKVNIIPVIAKSDTMTPEETAHFKKQIMDQIKASKIRIYEFPESDGEEESERKENRRLKERVPFAVVGSNTIIETSDGKKTRGRRYPWGVVDIENMDHCDFVPLRNMLIRTHLQDLKDVTNNVHYENFRCRKLAGVAGGTVDKIPNKNPLAQIEEERKEHHSKLAKMEKEMEEVFERKVREKKQKLADSEADLEKRHRESKDKLEAQKMEVSGKLAAFESERRAWEDANNVTIDELKRLSMESLDGGPGGQKKKKGLSALGFGSSKSQSTLQRF